MEKQLFKDEVLRLTGIKTVADRECRCGTLTYRPHGSYGKDRDVNEVVYDLMIIAAYDQLKTGQAVYRGDFTAAEMAGKAGYLHQFMENVSEDWEHYSLIAIETKMFQCSYPPGEAFSTIAEWEGVMNLSPKKYYRFTVEGRELPKDVKLKPYTRCHGYKPTTISLVMNERRINEKFEVLGRLYQSLTSEGMRRAMSVCAAARLFDNKSYEVKALIKTAMRWKLWRDYAKKEGASLLPIAFSETDFQCGPECYKQVDTKYVQELVDHWNKLVADSPMPEWPKDGDLVQFKNREKLQKKYRGKYLCEGMTASLSTYGDRIEWRASVRVKKYDNEYFLPGQLEPAPEKPVKKAKVKTKKPAAVKVQGSDYTVKSDGRTETFGSYIPKALAEEPKPDTMTLAEQLRQALLKRLAA